MKAKIFFLSLVAFFALSVQAAVVDTINVRSDAMNKEIQTVIVLPGSGDNGSCHLFTARAWRKCQNLDRSETKLTRDR